MPTPRSLVFRALEDHVIRGRADDIALTDDAGSMTYAHLLHDSASVAGAFRELGVTTGTPVAIDLAPGRERATAVLACARLGAEITDDAAVRLTADPATLHTPDTEAPWDLLLRAGRGEPAGAPGSDPDGYEERLTSSHADIFGPLLAGGTITIAT